MPQDTQLQAIQDLVDRLLAEGPEDIFLVSVKIKPTNNIKVFLDADNGLSIDRCVKINRAMYRIIEEEGWYPEGNFSLEVSSPGVDEPLKMPRQYKKNIGRKVALLLNDDTKAEGRLVAADNENLELQYTEGKNRKATLVNKLFTLDAIKETIVLVEF
jgi:ribosome maturation factor RimP